MRFFFLFIDFLHKWWMRLAHVLGYVNSHIILGFIYIVVIGAYAVCIQLIAVAQKILRPNKSTTYWKDAEQVGDIEEELRRQF